MSLSEIEEVYLPLSRLLNLYVAAVQGLYRATATFLGHGEEKVPFLIGLAGSVAVGKSTAARALRELLVALAAPPAGGHRHDRRLPLPDRGPRGARPACGGRASPRATTCAQLVAFVRDLKAGKDRVTSPVYSHLVYDIVPGETVVVERPDIVIVEGLNVLQTGPAVDGQPRVFVSDFFDFTIYVDADDGGHPLVVRRALPRAAQHRLPGPVLVLPPLRAPLRRGGGGDGGAHLGRDQRAEPREEHPPHPRARRPHPAEAPRPRGRGSAAAEAVVVGGCCAHPPDPPLAAPE